MLCVWQIGIVQAGLRADGEAPTSMTTVMGVSLAFSRLISNVPLVALYLPILQDAGVSTPVWTALAATSSVATSIFIIGAASNVIIV